MLLASLLFSLFSLAPGPAHAATDVDALVRETEARVAIEYKDLIAYRRTVEAGAFDETMALCPGYRRARGWGPGDQAGDYRAWVRIFREGAEQPFSNLDGVKADFVNATQVRMWHLDFWLRSVHTLYLIHSDGFKAASARCLGTDDVRERDRFALAIVSLDVAGSLTTELTTVAGFAQIFGVIKRSTRWAWMPAGQLIRALKTRITKPMVTVAGLVIVPLAGAGAYDYLQTLRRGVRGAQEFINGLDAEREKLKVTGRKFLMAKAVKLLGAALDKNDLSEFETWAVANVHQADRAKAHADFERIQSHAAPEPGDEQYDSVLKAVLPVLDQLNLTP